MHDLSLDILFMRTRPRELAQAVAIRAGLRQARSDIPWRRRHAILAVLDCLWALGICRDSAPQHRR
jgi:hypothetical protein